MVTTSTDLRAQSEAVVAQALTTHRVEHWIATNSYVCGCKVQHLTLAQAVAHQAQAVMRALNEWVNR